MAEVGGEERGSGGCGWLVGSSGGGAKVGGRRRQHQEQHKPNTTAYGAPLHTLQNTPCLGLLAGRGECLDQCREGGGTFLAAGSAPRLLPSRLVAARTLHAIAPFLQYCKNCGRGRMEDCGWCVILTYVN